MAGGSWQSQQGNALPRQETATKEQLGDSEHVLRAVAPRAAQLWVAGVSLSFHQSVPAARAGPAQVAVRGHRYIENISGWIFQVPVCTSRGFLKKDTHLYITFKRNLLYTLIS